MNNAKIRKIANHVYHAAIAVAIIVSLCASVFFDEGTVAFNVSFIVVSVSLYVAFLILACQEANLSSMLASTRWEMTKACVSNIGIATFMFAAISALMWEVGVMPGWVPAMSGILSLILVMMGLSV